MMSSKNNLVMRTETALGAEVQLAARARHVLRQNDMGDWTCAAPNLYPHQWSWDSAFITIGLAHLSTRRAAKELLALFGHQWGPARFLTLSSIQRLRRTATFQGRSTGLAPRLPPMPRPRRPTPVAFVSLRSTPSPPYASGRWPRGTGERESTKRGLSCGRSTPSSSCGTATS